MKHYHLNWNTYIVKEFVTNCLIIFSTICSNYRMAVVLPASNASVLAQISKSKAQSLINIQMNRLIFYDLSGSRQMNRIGNILLTTQNSQK